MHVHRDKTFTNQTFHLDEVSLLNCTLRDCDLFYSGGDFDVQACRFEACRFHFRGLAKNTVALCQMTGMMPTPQMPGKCDGTETELACCFFI
jgi:hypothetical protein